MKVVFISNFLTHHQVPFCIEMQKRLGEDFKFISTVKIFEWRLKLGFKDLDSEVAENVFPIFAITYAIILSNKSTSRILFRLTISFNCTELNKSNKYCLLASVS